ncbi:hypothetical protein VQH23_03435 [Pararoseomonas sp. SCSIO 73927]
MPPQKRAKSPAAPSRALAAGRCWLARLVRDILLWLRAPAGNRPDWRAR